MCVQTEHAVDHGHEISTFYTVYCVLCVNAAVIIGHITDLSRLSVRMSVPCGLWTREQRGWKTVWSNNNLCWLQGSVTLRTLDSRLQGRWFHSWSCRYQVTTTWMDDCLRTGRPSRYITNTKVILASHPFGVDKSSTVPGGR